MGHPGWFWMFVIVGLPRRRRGSVHLLLAGRFAAACPLPERSGETGADKRAGARGGEKRLPRACPDALRNGRGLAAGADLSDHSGGGLWSDFFLPTRVRCAAGHQSRPSFASVVTAIRWWRRCLAPGLSLATPIAPASERNIAALTLLAAAVGIAVSGLVAPVLAIIALCVAAVGGDRRAAGLLDDADAAAVRHGAGRRDWL